MADNRILLQIALDILTLEQVKSLLTPELLAVVDIVEVGTPLIIRYGLSMVEKVKSWTEGKKIIFSDTKIVDAGRWETREALSAGADLVSVLAGASTYTLEEVRDTAHSENAQMVVDIIDLSLTDHSKVSFLYSLRPDYLCIHLSSDAVKKGGSLLEFSQQLPFVSSRQLPLMVAGGINVTNLPVIVHDLEPAIVVAGSSLTGAQNPDGEAKKMRRIIDEFILFRDNSPSD
jgi:3-hexulose-6-phosphate synthase